MEITRINTYSDPRFSRAALMQHGCYLADGKPYEVEIVAPREAIIRGPSPEAYPAIAEEFRFYAPEVCRFFSESKALRTGSNIGMVLIPLLVLGS